MRVIQDPKLQTKASRQMLITLLNIYSGLRLVAYERNKYGYIDEQGMLLLNGPGWQTVSGLVKRKLLRRLDQSRIFRYEYGVTQNGEALAIQHIELHVWAMQVAQRQKGLAS